MSGNKRGPSEDTAPAAKEACRRDEGAELEANGLNSRASDGVRKTGADHNGIPPAKHDGGEAGKAERGVKSGPRSQSVEDAPGESGDSHKKVHTGWQCLLRSMVPQIC
jgi:hypothetical protein